MTGEPLTYHRVVVCGDCGHIIDPPVRCLRPNRTPIESVCTDCLAALREKRERLEAMLMEVEP